jgi:hypothetical protein
VSDKIRRAPHNTENPFAQISREMLQDKTLSYEARGLLGYLLSKSGNWETRVSDLQIKGAGRDKVYRIIAELQAKGYISLRRKYQDEKGQWQWTPYDVYETRELNPFTENPYTDKPNTENTEIKAVKKNTKERDTKEEQKENTSVPVGTQSVSPDSDWSIADEAGDNAMFTPLTGKQNSARADNSAKRLQNATATTPPPSPTPSAPAPEMINAPDALTGADGTETGKTPKKTSAAAALAEAMEMEPAGKDWNVFGKVAKTLIDAGIGMDEFAAYVSHWRKKAEAGKWTFTTTSLTGGTRMSEYVKERGKEQREIEAAQKLRESIPPEYLPRSVPPEKRATPEQIANALAIFNTPIFKASDLREDVS